MTTLIDPNQSFNGLFSKSYTSTQSWLKKYLSNSDIDPYWWPQLLEDWINKKLVEIDENELNLAENDIWDNVEYLTPEQLQEFTKWLEENIDKYAWEDPADYQPNRAMEFKYLVKPLDWLVHFSDNAWDISFEGFQHGSELRGLHYTKGRDDPNSKYGEFAFAYYADVAEHRANQHAYGKDAVLFRTNSGVYVYHYGDEENQVIFEKDTARDRIYMNREDNNSWFISDVISGRKLISGEFDYVVNWVKRNFDQYRKRLVAMDK